MMLTDEIYTMAAFFVPSDESGIVLRALCAAAEAELTARLKKHVRKEDCRDSFVCAAALMAASHFSATQAAKKLRSFTAGEISVTEQSEDAAAEALQRHAWAIMQPYCDVGFTFMGVRG